MERKFKVTMINTRLNFRQSITVYACSCSEAGGNARAILGKDGYDVIESIVCME